MTLRLFDTLSRSVRPFGPAEPGHVRMYTCGPTVYDRAHIGNFRTFTWEDLLRRYLEWKGWRVTQVMNLTDVDDKTIRAAVERGVSLEAVTGPVIEDFFEDWDRLGLRRAAHYPRATAHVPAMIRLVEILEEKGYCYEAEGSVYFAIGRFPEYGRLARLDPESLRSAGRARGDEEYSKDDPRDFVLWKGGERADEGDVATWDSPWGPGRPGWHLECSVLAMEFLGPTLDIHTGGVDNIFPHHTNEIAQSEAATGETFSRFWLHAAHLLVEGAKMSKSEGNYYTIPDLLERGHRPSAIRYLLLSAHHRSQLNFTIDGLEQADRAVARIAELRERLAEARRARRGSGDGRETGDVRASADMGEGAVHGRTPRDALRGAAARAREAFEESMDDDLSVSGALAAVFDFVRDVNVGLDAGPEPTPASLEAALDFLDDFDAVFGVLSVRDRERERVTPETERWLEERIEERRRARADGDYARADAIRDEVESSGFLLEDTAGGTRWKVRGGGDAEEAGGAGRSGAAAGSGAAASGDTGEPN